MRLQNTGDFVHLIAPSPQAWVMIFILFLKDIQLMLTIGRDELCSRGSHSSQFIRPTTPLIWGRTMLQPHRLIMAMCVSSIRRAKFRVMPGS